MPPKLPSDTTNAVPGLRRFAARTCGGLTGALVAGLAALVLCLVLAFFTQPDVPSWVGSAMDITLIIFVVSGAWIGWQATRERSRYAWSICLLGLGSGLLFYFGKDEKPSAGLYLPPATPQQQADYDILLWFSKAGTPQSRLTELSTLVQNDLFKTLPADPKELCAHVAQHTGQIRAAWETNTLGREWLGRVASMGTVVESSLAPEAVILDYRAVRNVVNLHLAYALLLAEEGNVSGAYQTLAPTIHFGQKLGAARLLVHSMIGTVVTKQAYQILRMFAPALPTKQRTEAVFLLGSVIPIEDRIYTVFAGELGFEECVLSNLARTYDSNSQILSRLQAWRLIFHRQRTLNGLAALYLEIIPALSDRNFKKADFYANALVTGPTPCRNFVGTLMQRMIVPAFDKAFKEMWRVEDQRRSLLVQLDI